MPALRKPHRIAFLLPEVTLEGADVAHAHEVALLLWTACIEACQRHPGLAVYDAVKAGGRFADYKRAFEASGVVPSRKRRLMTLTPGD